MWQGCARVKQPSVLWQGIARVKQPSVLWQGCAWVKQPSVLSQGPAVSRDPNSFKTHLNEAFRDDEGQDFGTKKLLEMMMDKILVQRSFER